MQKKINLVLADDEVESINILKLHLSKIPGVEIIGTSKTVVGLSRQVIHLKPDAVLLDIRMPPGNGLDVATDLKKHGYQGKIIFVTAYSQYAIEAIKRSAFDYLLKPVDLDDVKSMVDNLRDEHSAKLTENGISQNTKIKINTRSGFLLIAALDIVYIKADGNYSKLQLSEDKTETTSMNLGRLEAMLPRSLFFRISRSVIVNLHYLRRVNRKFMECELQYEGRAIRFNIGSANLKRLEELI